jgi:hypothetical protein
MLFPLAQPKWFSFLDVLEYSSTAIVLSGSKGCTFKEAKTVLLLPPVLPFLSFLTIENHNRYNQSIPPHLQEYSTSNEYLSPNIFNEEKAEKQNACKSTRPSIRQLLLTK